MERVHREIAFEDKLADQGLVVPPSKVREMFEEQEAKEGRATTKAVPVRTTPPPLPYSIEAALNTGWTIRKENGRQVVLVKDGRSVTLYRPKIK